MINRLKCIQHQRCVAPDSREKEMETVKIDYNGKSFFTLTFSLPLFYEKKTHNLISHNSRGDKVWKLKRVKFSWRWRWWWLWENVKSYWTFTSISSWLFTAVVERKGKIWYMPKAEICFACVSNIEKIDVV